MITKLIIKIAEAISVQEGFPSKKSLACRNNNPGNLRSWGDNPIVNGYTKFPTVSDGWAALYKQVEKNIKRKLTLQEFFAGKPGVYPGYAPAADKNDPGGYAKFVGKRVGIPIDVPLNEVVLTDAEHPIT